MSEDVNKQTKRYLTDKELSSKENVLKALKEAHKKEIEELKKRLKKEKKENE